MMQSQRFIIYLLVIVFMSGVGIFLTAYTGEALYAPLMIIIGILTSIWSVLDDIATSLEKLTQGEDAQEAARLPVHQPTIEP